MAKPLASLATPQLYVWQLCASHPPQAAKPAGKRPFCGMPSQLVQLQTNWSSSDPPGNSRSAKSQPWVGNLALLTVPKWDVIPKQLGEAGRPRFITELTRDSSNYTNTRSITWPLSDPSKVPCAARQAINFPFRRQPRCTRSRQWAWHVYLQSGTRRRTKRKKKIEEAFRNEAAAGRSSKRGTSWCASSRLNLPVCAHG